MDEAHGHDAHAGPPPGYVERHLPGFAYMLIPLGVTFVVAGWVSAFGLTLLTIRGSLHGDERWPVVVALTYALIVTIGGFVASAIMRRWDRPAEHGHSEV